VHYGFGERLARRRAALILVLCNTKCALISYCCKQFFIVCAAVGVPKKISTDYHVHGVTSVDDELFVLLNRAKSQVAVYSVNDYQLLRHLNLPGVATFSFNNITSCKRHKCLYMSDRDKHCVHGYNLENDRPTEWSLSGLPYGLSVTPNSTLLVTCRGESNKLLEMMADSGRCVREIALQSDIMHPWHSVQLTTGQFVVCHGALAGDLHRVCVVGDDGKVTDSYGGQCGSGVEQLNDPCYLAVDEESQNVFVADMCNRRVVLLNQTMKFVRYVVERLSKRPDRLYFHQATRCLFVGHCDRDVRDVTVIQL